jgi:hypothetical protein
VTFGLLWLLGARQQRPRWAAITAIVLLAVGILASFASSGVFVYAWPVVLILGGLYLILRLAVFRSRS